MSDVSAVRVAIVDYEMGNRRSVEKALLHLGAKVEVTCEHDALRNADALVLPGVGAFPAGAERLRALALDALLREQVAAGKPLLGICLGMELLFDSSDELGVVTAGLGLIAGRVRQLQAPGLRLPHIGWNDVSFDRSSALLAELDGPAAAFYHVHSYVAHPDYAEHVVGTAQYGERFAAIVQRDNVYGTQFHPEKSSSDGLALLGGFLSAARRSALRVAA